MEKVIVYRSQVAKSYCIVLVYPSESVRTAGPSKCDIVSDSSLCYMESHIGPQDQVLLSILPTLVPPCCILDGDQDENLEPDPGGPMRPGCTCPGCNMG